MNKRLFFREFLLLIQNRAFIVIMALFVVIVILGQRNLYHDTVQSIQSLGTTIKLEAVTNSTAHSVGPVDSAEFARAYALLQPRYFLNNVLSVLSGIFPIFFVLIASVLIGQEFSHRTAPMKAAYWGWPRVITVKTALFFAAMLCSVILLSAVGCITDFFLWRSIGTTVRLPVDIGGYSVIRQLLAMLLPSLFYGILAILVTQISGVTLIGSFLPISVMYFFEPMIPCPYLPFHLTATMLQKSFLFSSFSPFQLTAAGADISFVSCASLLFLYALILFSLSLLSAHRRLRRG